MINTIIGSVEFAIVIIELIYIVKKTIKAEVPIVINCGTRIFLATFILCNPTKDMLIESLPFLLFILVLHIITYISYICGVIRKKKERVYQDEIEKIKNWK